MCVKCDSCLHSSQAQGGSGKARNGDSGCAICPMCHTNGLKIKWSVVEMKLNKNLIIVLTVAEWVHRVIYFPSFETRGKRPRNPGRGRCHQMVCRRSLCRCGRHGQSFIDNDVLVPRLTRLHDLDCLGLAFIPSPDGCASQDSTTRPS